MNPEHKSRQVETLLNKTREMTRIIEVAQKATNDIYDEANRKKANAMLGDALTSIANLLKSGADTLLELGNNELIAITKPEKREVHNEPVPK